MSLWARYFLEREGVECIEEEYAVASYKIEGEVCYLQDVYIVPEKRQMGLASSIADRVGALAKEKGCKYLVSSVCFKDPHVDRNIKVLHGYGMSVLRGEGTMLYFKKEL